MERISKKSAVMRRAVVIGATSGIGREIALLLLKEGWRIGIAGRREERLRELQAQCPERVCVRTVDIRKPGAEGEARILVEELGGMDLFVHCSGVGHQNYELEAETELDTVETNAAGFVRMTGFAFHYFLERGGGHVAASHHTLQVQTAVDHQIDQGLQQLSDEPGKNSQIQGQISR